eukprot:sb/3476144/
MIIRDGFDLMFAKGKLPLVRPEVEIIGEACLLRTLTNTHIYILPLIFFSTPILREFIFSTISLKIQTKGRGPKTRLRHRGFFVIFFLVILGTHRDQLVKELALMGGSILSGKNAKCSES